ncbi:MAG: sugar transferase, partial [Flavobacteriaceae bacterium]|nr:sugar transferase [Flavobacteriaceae bacterium]
THKLMVQYFDKDFNKYFPFSDISRDNRLYLVFQRLIDVLFSVIGLLGFTVLIPFVVIGNLFGNKGPLFYAQDRVGKNGINFKIYKLRSMVVDAEKNGAVWAKKNDARVTKFGRFLRQTRIDELPQFYNILKGDMSMIGPRPERPIFVEQLSKEIPFYGTRNIIKPGLTGWAQVNTEYGGSVEESLEKLQYDLYYVKHRGIFIDLNIIKRTLSTVIFFRGR